jgi:hypothetical protein
MKSIVNRMAILLLIGALTSVLALGKTTEKKVTFVQSLTVNGTLVKKGTYKVTFNDETGELTISKGGKVVATAQARLEKSDNRTMVYKRSDSKDPDAIPALTAVALRDGNQATVVNGTNTGMNVRN